jgi:predicted DNA-binding WGR domain protein
VSNNGKLLICQEGTANKYWKYELRDDWGIYVEWGRLGGTNQNQTKSFGSAAARQKFIDQKVSEKQRKGYAEKTDDEYQKEEKTAQALGHQNKLQNMEWVQHDESKKKLLKLSEYNPNEYVFVEIVNSWSKKRQFLLIGKNSAHSLTNVTIQKNGNIKYTRTGYADTGFVQAVRDYLSDLAQKVREVINTFAGVGARVLSLGDDSTERSESDNSMVKDLMASVGGDGSASEQVVTKFAGLGARKLWAD